MFDRGSELCSEFFCGRYHVFSVHWASVIFMGGVVCAHFVLCGRSCLGTPFPTRGPKSQLNVLMCV